MLSDALTQPFNEKGADQLDNEIQDEIDEQHSSRSWRASVKTKRRERLNRERALPRFNFSRLSTCLIFQYVALDGHPIAGQSSGLVSRVL